MLTYRHTDTLEVVGFSDSDYAGYVDDKKSTSGYIFMIAEGAISWKSVRPNKFQFLEKWQNHNFGYKILISIKKILNLFSGSWMMKQISPFESSREI